VTDIQTFTCFEMERIIKEGENALIYNPKFREFGIQVLDGGSSVQIISYCPWCGKSLPSSLRDEWFDRIEILGLEPDDEGVPEEMQTDAWWKTKR